MSMNPFRGKTQFFEFGPDAALQIERLISAVKERDAESLSQKLDTANQKLAELANTISLMETRLETVHSLVFDLVTSLTTDPEKITQLAAQVKAVREKLKSSVDAQQTKGD